MSDYSIRDLQNLTLAEIKARRVDRARAILLDLLTFAAGATIIWGLLWAVSLS